MFCLIIILSVVGVLTTSIVVPALAIDNVVQQIKTDLDGFAFLPNCCHDSKAHVEGNLITKSDGSIQLSSQSGTVTIGATSYQLKFEPTGKMNILQETDVCTSGTIYDQLGDLELTGNDGTLLKGLGVYSWGNSSGCPDGSSSFTYFGGKLHNMQGQTIEFFTVTDSLPMIK